MACKANVSDARESPAIDIADLLQRRGAVVSCSDPFVPSVRGGSVSFDAISPADAFDAGLHCEVTTTAHEGVDTDVAHHAPHALLMVDTRNVLRGVEGTHIFRL